MTLFLWPLILEEERAYEAWKKAQEVRDRRRKERRDITTAERRVKEAATDLLRAEMRRAGV